MVEEIQAVELRELLERDASSVLLIDVREADEHARVKIGESSWLVPMIEVETELESIREKASAVENPVVYCRSGGRSEMAIRWLQEQGVQGLKNLRGGINAYAREADSSLEPY